MDKANLQHSHNLKQQQLSSAQANRGSIEEQLEFVREQKSKLSTLKSDFKTNKMDAVKVDMAIIMMKWSGSNYGKFSDSYVQLLCQEKYNHFINEVDNNLDALVTEERRLENALLENDGLIGKLRQGLNWLESEIEKIIN